MRLPVDAVPDGETVLVVVGVAVVVEGKSGVGVWEHRQHVGLEGKARPVGVLPHVCLQTLRPAAPSLQVPSCSLWPAAALQRLGFRRYSRVHHLAQRLLLAVTTAK